MMYLALAAAILTIILAIEGLKTVLNEVVFMHRRRIIDAVRVENTEGHFIDVTLYIDKKPIKATILSGTAYDLARELERAVEMSDPTSSALGPYWNPQVIQGGKSDVSE